MKHRPTAVCARCGKTRTVSFRCLCRSCSVRACQTGTLAQWPGIYPAPRTLREAAEEFAFLEAAGKSYEEISTSMGYSLKSGSLKLMIIRAQRAQLLPKRTPLCGWEPRAVR